MMMMMRERKKEREKECRLVAKVKGGEGKVKKLDMASDDRE